MKVHFKVQNVSYFAYVKHFIYFYLYYIVHDAWLRKGEY